MPQQYSSGGGGSGGSGLSPYMALTALPTLTAFSAVNLGTVAVNDEGQSYGIVYAGEAAGQVRGFEQVLNAPPYTVTAAFVEALTPQNAEVGIFIHDTVSTKLCTCRWNPNDHKFTQGKWNSPSSGLSLNGTPLYADGNGILWFRIRDDGTNQIYYGSINGKTWFQLFSEASGTFVVPNRCGFHISSSANGNTVMAGIISWKVTYP